MKNKTEKIKLPSKKTINLVQKEESKVEKAAFGVGLVIILIGSLALAKFGVVDLLNKQNQVESEYKNIQTTVQAIEASMADYDQVLSDYQLYSDEWLKGSSGYVESDRRDILDIFEKEIFPRGAVGNLSISGNTVNFSMSGMPLNDISDMCKVLETYDIIGYCTFRNGSTTDTTENMAFNITLSLIKGAN